VFAWWWVEQRRLRFLGKAAGAVCLVAFAGKAFPVQRGFGNQPIGLGCERIMPCSA